MIHVEGLTRYYGARAAIRGLEGRASYDLGAAAGYPTCRVPFMSLWNSQTNSTLPVPGPG